jgi:hypothetical protein
VLAAAIGRDDIGYPIPGEVADRKRSRSQTCRVLVLQRERAAHITQENRHLLGAAVSQYEVNGAIPVEVAGCHHAGRHAHPHQRLRPKAAVGGSEENRQMTGGSIQPCEIDASVTIEIRHQHRAGWGCHGRPARAELAVAVAEAKPGAERKLFRDGLIGDPVLVEVGDGDDLLS